jgi:phosphocarrier protein HPr
MPEKDVTLTNDVGLHARPAAVFAKKAGSFLCDVTVVKGSEEANAKSILAVLKLDVRQGDTVTLRTMGEGADQALVALVELVESL